MKFLSLVLVLAPALVACGDSGSTTATGSATKSQPSASTKPSASAPAASASGAASAPAPDASASASGSASASASASGSASASASSGGPECDALCGRLAKCETDALKYIEGELAKLKLPADKKSAALAEAKENIGPGCQKNCGEGAGKHPEAAKKAAACVEKADCTEFFKCVQEVNKEEAMKAHGK
ncbi:MAG: hypothetical protein IT373_11765 [Polyangiaceae bacterium]|nr:hypothetical protein [Polyangiaceae bacterium]